MPSKLIVLLSVFGLICVTGAWVTEIAEAQPSNEIDVFLIAGQSNAAYTFRAVPGEASPICKVGTAFYFGDCVSPVGYTEWDPTADYGIFDMVNPDGTAHIGGLEQPFAAEYTKRTGHKVCIINVAVPGAKIVQWYPGSEGIYYDWAQEVFAKAVEKLEEQYTIKCKSMIWLQGEGNPTWNIGAYQTRFLTIMSTMDHSSDTFGYFHDEYTFDNCMISLVRQYRGQNSCIAQVELAAKNPNITLGCIICDTFNFENGLLYPDNTHYTQRGLNIVAKDLAKSYLETYY